MSIGICYGSDLYNICYKLLLLLFRICYQFQIFLPKTEGTHISPVLTVINNGFPSCSEGEEQPVSKRTYSTPPSTCRCLVGLLETSTEGDVKTYRFSYKMGRSDRQEKQNLPHCCRRYAPNCMRQGRVKFCSLQTILTRTGRIAKKARSGKSYAIFGMCIIVLWQKERQY